MRTVYASISDIDSAATIHYTPNTRASIKNKLIAAADRADELCRQQFYPNIRTKRFNRDTPGAIEDGGTLFTDTDWLELDQVTLNGDIIPPADLVELRDYFGLRFDSIGLLSNSQYAWTQATDEWYSIMVTGTTGYSNNTHHIASLTSDITDTETILVTPGSNKLDVGALIRINDEWLHIVDRDWTTSAAVTISDITIDQTTIDTNVATWVPGDRLRIGWEQLEVVDYAGTAIKVVRAVNGTTPSPHLTGAAINEWTTYTVERGVNGSTPAPHLTGAAISQWQPPAGVKEHSIAYVLTHLGQEASSYNRTIGTGDQQREATGRGLDTITRTLVADYRRRRNLRIA